MTSEPEPETSGTNAGEGAGEPPTHNAMIEQVAREILLTILPHVPFDGWTKAALVAGAQEAGYDLDTARLAFPHWPVDAIELHSRMADERMLADLEAVDLAPLKIRDRVATAIRLRLTANAGDREAIRRALGVLALPQNAPVALRSLYRTVDTIWWGIGDTSVDFSFYTKRTLLAGVYTATVLYWLEDRSPDFEETWSFLDRRLDDVLRIPRTRFAVESMLRRLPTPGTMRRRQRIRRRTRSPYGRRG